MTNKRSAMLNIPVDMARRKSLDRPAHVVVEETSDGILIWKLNLSEVEKAMKTMEFLSSTVAGLTPP
ncbi:MAG TPA: hypothetical protein VJ799_04310 [Nitrososphaeraceae archaeon]|nr:hypothetical protein [Nitrososphaeraceae archaeon]